MKFVKAAIVLGCMYPPAFFAQAGATGGGGAAGDVIQKEGQELVTISVSIESNRVNTPQTFIPSDILELF